MLRCRPKEQSLVDRNEILVCESITDVTYLSIMNTKKRTGVIGQHISLSIGRQEVRQERFACPDQEQVSHYRAGTVKHRIRVRNRESVLSLSISSEMEGCRLSPGSVISIWRGFSAYLYDTWSLCFSTSYSCPSSYSICLLSRAEHQPQISLIHLP